MSNELLDRALADLREHPDSTAREIAQRIFVNDRRVFKVLDNDDRCQRWKRAGGSVWLWKIHPCPNAPHGED